MSLPAGKTESCDTYGVYLDYTNGDNEMDTPTYVKLIKDLGILDEKLTERDLNLTFAKVKADGSEKITFARFSASLVFVAQKKRLSEDALKDAMSAAFHDDKALHNYNDVPHHTHCGPPGFEPLDHTMNKATRPIKSTSTSSKVVTVPESPFYENNWYAEKAAPGGADAHDSAFGLDKFSDVSKTESGGSSFDYGSPPDSGYSFDLKPMESSGFPSGYHIYATMPMMDRDQVWNSQRQQPPMQYASLSSCSAYGEDIAPELYDVPIGLERFLTVGNIGPASQSIGSADHRTGKCNPCSFFHRPIVGCENGSSCTFCHLCPASEGRRRKKMKHLLIKARKEATRVNHQASLQTV